MIQNKKAVFKMAIEPLGVAVRPGVALMGPRWVFPLECFEVQTFGVVGWFFEMPGQLKQSFVDEA